MCLVIAFVATIYAIAAFNAGNIASATVAVVIALFFTGLLFKNIMDVKKMRQENNANNMKEKS